MSGRVGEGEREWETAMRWVWGVGVQAGYRAGLDQVDRLPLHGPHAAGPHATGQLDDTVSCHILSVLLTTMWRVRSFHERDMKSGEFSPHTAVYAFPRSSRAPPSFSSRATLACSTLFVSWGLPRWSSSPIHRCCCPHPPPLLSLSHSVTRPPALSLYILMSCVCACMCARARSASERAAADG